MQAQLPLVVAQNIIRLADGDDLSATDGGGSFAAPGFVQHRQHQELERQIYGLRLELTAVWDSPDVAQGTQCDMPLRCSRACTFGAPHEESADVFPGGGSSIAEKI